MIKKVASVALASVLALSCFGVSASAKKDYNIKTSYKYYTECTRTSNCDAYVCIKVYNTTAGYRNDVKMTTTSGKTIWSERGAIANNGQRKFRLGTDNKTYRIYVKTQRGSAAVCTLYYNYCTAK